MRAPPIRKPSTVPSRSRSARAAKAMKMIKTTRVSHTFLAARSLRLIGVGGVRFSHHARPGHHLASVATAVPRRLDAAPGVVEPDDEERGAVDGSGGHHWHQAGRRPGDQAIRHQDRRRACARGLLDGRCRRRAGLRPRAKRLRQIDPALGHGGPALAHQRPGAARRRAGDPAASGDRHGVSGRQPLALAHLDQEHPPAVRAEGPETPRPR